MAGFSQGFNSTFRSLDNAFQWRAQQDESARQYDETLSENKRQFNETAAQQNAVNQSLIKLRDAQGVKIATVTDSIRQEMDHATEMLPLVKRETEAGIGLTRSQTALTGERANQLQQANKEARLTQDDRVAADRAASRRQKFEDEATVYGGQVEIGKQLQYSTTDEDGRPRSAEQLVYERPDQLAAFAANMTRSGEFTDIGFDIGEYDMAIPKPVDASDPSQGFYIFRSRGANGKLEGITDGSGEPVVISAEEMVQYADEALREVDQLAVAGGAGSVRQEQVEAQAAETARRQVGPPPSNPGTPPANVDPNELEQQIDELEAQREQVQRRLDELPGFRARRPDVPLDAMTPQTRAQAEEHDALTERKAQLDRQLGDISGDLQSYQAQSQLANQYQQESERYQRTLADQTYGNTTNVLRTDALNRQPGTASETSNLIASGRADVSAEDLQAQRQERITDTEKLIRDKLSYVVTRDEDGNRKVVDDEVMGNRIANQFRSLVTNPDTQGVWNQANDAGMMPSIVQAAIDLSGNDPDRVSLQTGLTMMMENVATQDVGSVMDYVSRMVADEGGIMPPEQYKQLSQRAAQVVSERGGNDRVTSDEAKALAQLVLNPQRTQRTLGE